MSKNEIAESKDVVIEQTASENGTALTQPFDQRWREANEQIQAICKQYGVRMFIYPLKDDEIVQHVIGSQLVQVTHEIRYRDVME